MFQGIALQIVVFLGQQAALSTRSYGSDQLHKTAANAAAFDPHATDLPNIKIDVSKNGEPLSTGLGSAVQGNPLTAVAWLANTLGAYGIALEAGEVILSGSVVPLEPVQAGDVMSLVMSGEGFESCSVSCRFI